MVPVALALECRPNYDELMHKGRTAGMQQLCTYGPKSLISEEQEDHMLPNLAASRLVGALVESMLLIDSSSWLQVHNSLCMLTIDLLGSEEQKKQLLPDLAALKTIGAWGLTEPSNGSDAAALQTTAKKVEGGWELNGAKRWIGNATFADYTVIWARSSETNQVRVYADIKTLDGCSFLALLCNLVHSDVATSLEHMHNDGATSKEHMHSQGATSLKCKWQLSNRPVLAV